MVLLLLLAPISLGWSFFWQQGGKACCQEWFETQGERQGEGETEGETNEGETKDRG